MIHKYMEKSHGDSLCSYLKQTKNFFSFTKTDNRRAEQVLPGVGTSGREKKVKKGCGRANMEQIPCTHVCK
jgi:hypothetical protein